jgi:pyruvate/2-oxoglutarate dehydrogenase complex dihydrolipoamide dehydrogenase (E3) component
MSKQQYDLVIIGAGAGGLIAAGFAVKLGARVALVEKDRIGGDCTWIGCVPSKALLKVAKIAHHVRTASQYGIMSQAPVTDMAKVHEYLDAAIQHIYKPTTAEALRQKGMDVYLGPARFADEESIIVGDQTLRSKHCLITTGARPYIPPISGLDTVPYLTYEHIFDTKQLPQSMIVVGGGPIGTEISQAYQRLGCQVTVVADRLLPKEDPDVRQVLQQVFEKEGIRFVLGRATSTRLEDETIVVSTGGAEARGELLFIASGRRPNLEGLDLEKAGVQYSEKGIKIDDHLRTTARHIYAAGDVVGGCQFSHFAGWQAFQAVRNALLPGSSAGFADVVPRITFTDPEVAHVGLTEEQARSQFGDGIIISRWDLSRVDRAVCDNDLNGFIKIIANNAGSILACTIVAERAGESINEVAVAMKRGLKVDDIAGTIHAYPTYSTGLQLLLTEMSLERFLSGTPGKIIRAVSGLSGTAKEA